MKKKTPRLYVVSTKHITVNGTSSHHKNETENYVQGRLETIMGSIPK